jgi:hypothetical protein
MKNPLNWIPNVWKIGTTTIQTGPDATVRLGLPALSMFSGHAAASMEQESDD